MRLCVLIACLLTNYNSSRDKSVMMTGCFCSGKMNDVLVINWTLFDQRHVCESYWQWLTSLNVDDGRWDWEKAWRGGSLQCCETAATQSTLILICSRNSCHVELHVQWTEHFDIQYRRLRWHSHQCRWPAGPTRRSDVATTVIHSARLFRAWSASALSLLTCFAIANCLSHRILLTVNVAIKLHAWRFSLEMIQGDRQWNAAKLRIWMLLSTTPQRHWRTCWKNYWDTDAGHSHRHEPVSQLTVH